MDQTDIGVACIEFIIVQFVSAKAFPAGECGFAVLILEIQPP
jgi:hypothetical protein